ncbi:MAG: dihydropteroate synthase [Desulfobacteraceae bacterium 4572_35.1]|nr:MAG: dihydropteroate synthase [Desulfobacteraceae bacterium 4572_35.1]
MGDFAPRILNLNTQGQVQIVMKTIGVDPAGITRMAGKALWMNVLLENVPCAAANILKQEMLAIGADAAVARGSVSCARSHTHVLLMASSKQFDRLIKRLPYQPFGLAGLAVELRSLVDYQKTFPEQLSGKDCYLTLDRPQVMAVINVTPDSFYDGGKSFSIETVLCQAEKHVAAGADLLDIGGESTRPGALAITTEEELNRVLPVVEALRNNFSIPVSVDTSKAKVAAEVLNSGANFINDISGLMFDDEMASVVAERGAGLFVMHTRGRPEVMQQDTKYDDLLGEVIAGLKFSIERAWAAGIPQNKLAVDPGIGFGKSVAGNLDILRNLDQLRCLGCPILLGTSRKSFIGSVLNQPQPQQRLYGSLTTVALGVANGARLFRVHDVAATRQTVDMAWEICCGKLD